MEKRLSELLGSTGEAIEVHTYHSFANKVLNIDRSGDQFSENGLLTDVQKCMILEKILSNSNLAGKYYDLKPANSLRILSLAKLFSLFKQEGIKTFLNDLLYLELPNGVQVGITETETSYLIPYRIASSKQRAPPTHAWLLWLNYLSTSSTRGYVTSLLSASRPQPSAPLV